MTRDEVHLELQNRETEYGISNEDIEEVINKIYDDFESRTCDSCKHFGFPDNEHLYEDCNFGGIDHIYSSSTFGCNKWESKDES